MKGRVWLVSSWLMLFSAPGFAAEAGPDGVPETNERREQERVPRIPQISFAEALRRAGAESYRVQKARAEMGSAAAEVKRSRANWLPTLNGVGTYTRLDGDRVVGDRVVSPANALNLSAQLEVPIVRAARWADTARQKESLEVAEGRVTEARRQALMDATRAYLRVLLEKRNVEIAERAVTVAQKQLSFMKTREQEGVGSRLEVTRAEHELHTNLAYLAARRASVYEAQENLGVALLHDGPLDASGSLLPSELPSLADALGSARERPDLVALRTQASSDQKRVDQAYLDYLPNLTASGMAFYQNPPSVNFPEFGWQLQLVLMVPLYDGGRRYGDQEARRAQAQASRTEIRQAELAAAAEVRAKAQQVESLLVAWQEAQNSARVAREALALAQRSFEEGSGTQIELIESERNVRDAETNAAIAEMAWLEARVLYRLAAGRLDIDGETPRP